MTFPHEFYRNHAFAERQREWLVYLDSKIKPKSGIGEPLEAQRGNIDKPISNEDAFNVDSRSIVVCPSLYERMRLPEAILKYRLPVNHRVILSNEIILECDNESVEKNAVITQEIVGKLQADEVPYIVGFTGGKGFHVHLWLDFGRIPLEPKVTEYFSKGTLHPRDFRTYWFRSQILPWCARLEEALGEIKLDMAMFNKNHLIREFGGLHDKTKKRKTALPSKAVKTPEDGVSVIFPGKVELWRPHNLNRVFARFIADYEDGAFIPAGQKTLLSPFKQWSK